MPAGTLGFEVPGEMTAEDYETVLAPALREVLDAGAEMRIVFVAGPDFKEANARAVWADVKLGVEAVFGHRKQWERMALVTDTGWIRRAAHAFGRMAPGELKVFSEAELDAAKEWVSASG